jgi:prepilin-type N-terminal cleavage/methylation domain-containing protein
MARNPSPTTAGRSSRRGAFTLVELLVVIGIIAVLVSIILPALGRARLAANRTMCLSNMQQLAQALYIYGAQYKGAVPPADPKANAGTSYTIWRSSGDGPDYIPRYTADGWVGPGYLFYARVLKNPKAFYCPSLEINFGRFSFVYDEKEWQNPTTGYRFMGYLYRVFGERQGSGVVGTEIDKAWKEVQKYKFGKMKSKALIMDVQMLGWGYGLGWPHRQPYGVNAAYSDGHAEFVQLNRTDFDAAYKYGTKPDSGVVNASFYTVVLFKALDDQNFTDLRKYFK